jgi:hypothetical protein
MTDLLLAQLADPFRIGLIIALVVTMLRTAAVTGRLVPLAAGVVFVAVIIPMTLQAGQADVSRAVAVGIVTNVILLGVVLGLWTLFRRLRG